MPKATIDLGHVAIIVPELNQTDVPGTTETIKKRWAFSIEDVDSVVGEHLPVLVPSVHAILAVFGAMALAGRTRPLSLILEGGSGNGKTTVAEMAFPIPGTSVSDYVYRSDRFTAKSFVTHAANKKHGELASIDMLPRLANKVLITKELAPLFRGREQEMQENFSILISVLDGRGFVSDSGMQGRRGYEDPIMFNWIGATTPLPLDAHRLMSQLGTRLLFYEVPSTKPTEEELLEFAEENAPTNAQQICNLVVNHFLEEFFLRHPVGSFPMEMMAAAKPLMLRLVRLARFLVHGRAEIKSEKIDSNTAPVAAMEPEGAWKVVQYFKELAFGHALICGRSHLDASDVDLVEHVAISSIPGHLRPLLKALRDQDLDSPTACKLCRVSLPTARNYMRELNLLGIAEITKGNGNRPDWMVLSKPYRWLENNC